VAAAPVAIEPIGSVSVSVYAFRYSKHQWRAHVLLSLAAAVANAGGMGGLGAVTTRPDGILEWAKEYRAQSNGSVQINLWIPDPAPARDQSAERRVREFLFQWGPSVPSGYDRFWREADIPTNGIKAVAAEPGGADEFAGRSVARALADELGFDRRSLCASRGWRRSALTDDRPDAGDSGECQRGMKSPRLRLSHRLEGYSAQEAPENGDW
jgi:hypothetical protein